jgi:hypothetical protein
MMFCNNSDKPSRRWFSRLTAGNYLKVLLTAALVAVICMAIFLSLGKIRLSQAVVHMALVLVYSVSISLPSMLLLNWIAFRYTERFPRLVFLFCAAALLVSSCWNHSQQHVLARVPGEHHLQHCHRACGRFIDHHV